MSGARPWHYTYAYISLSKSGMPPMFQKKTVRDIDVRGKQVLVRAMLNVPITDGKVGDVMRLRAAIPTLDYLLSQGAAVILISHHSTEGQTLAPVAPLLSEFLGGRPVQFVSDCIGPEATQAARDIEPGGIVVLENLRFHPEEEANDEAFAKTLASYAEVYVNDDFTTCHRKHASLVGVPKFLPAVAGLNVEKEVTTITSVLDNPKRPLVAVSGGAKISTKVPIVSFLLKKVDTLFVGGAMANTFVGALGKNVGKSLVETDQYETAKKIMTDAEAAGKKVLLPLDVVVARSVDDAEGAHTVLIDEVPEDWSIVDIGPLSVKQLEGVLKAEGSVVWNGPVGVAEKEAFSHGSRGVAQAIISSGAYSIVGGGDTADFVDGAKLQDKFGFVSTGGGASLELMSGNKLPGVEALLDK